MFIEKYVLFFSILIALYVDIAMELLLALFCMYSLCLNHRCLILCRLADRSERLKFTMNNNTFRYSCREYANRDKLRYGYLWVLERITAN